MEMGIRYKGPYLVVVAKRPSIECVLCNLQLGRIGRESIMPSPFLPHFALQLEKFY